MASRLNTTPGYRLLVPDGQRLRVDIPPTWSPALVDATQAWYDAQDATTLTIISDQVDVWNDKSGNDHHMTALSATKRPDYKASDPMVAGRPTVWVGGPATGLRGLASVGTLFWPKRVYFISYQGVDGTDPIWGNHVCLFSANDKSHRLTGRTGAGEDHWDGWRSDKNFDYDADGGYVYRNGSTENIVYTLLDPPPPHLPMPAELWTIGGNNVNEPHSWRLFSNGFDYTTWFGGLGEIIFTDGTEDLATQQKIEGYLAHKWGLSYNLPVTHPYYNDAEFFGFTLPPWTPSAIDTVAWYDASHEATVRLRGGQYVEEWRDKSRNGLHAVQAEESKQPDYYPADAKLNGMGSIGQASASGKIGLTAPSFSSRICYAVTRFADSYFSTYNVLFSGDNGGGKYLVRGDAHTSVNPKTQFRISDNLDYNHSTYKNGSTTDTNLAVLPMKNGALFRFELQTIQSQITSFGYNEQWNNRCWVGAYSEFIFTDGTEDLATKQKIEGYLAHKWGFEDQLPSDHPYKTEAP